MRTITTFLKICLHFLSYKYCTIFFLFFDINYATMNLIKMFSLIIKVSKKLKREALLIFLNWRISHVNIMFNYA